MGFSRIEYPYTGGPQDFAVNFSLGILEQNDVTVYVVGEVDGQGDQLLRTFTWVNTGTVRVTDPLPNPSTVVVERTVDKDQLEIDLQSTGAVTRVTLVRAFRQLMMNIHELLDGRADSFTGAILDSVVGVRDEAQQARIDAQAARDDAQTAETGAEGSANAAAASASAAATSETNAASSEAAASAAAAGVAANTAAAQSAASDASADATAAAASASAAATSETNAGASATAAAGSASAASSDAATADADRIAATAARTAAEDAEAAAAASAAAAAAEVQAAIDARLAADSVVLTFFRFTATASQTVFTGADDASNALSFTQGNAVVTLNGVSLIKDVDYTESGSGTITLTTAADAGDILSVINFSPGVASTGPGGGGSMSAAQIEAALDAYYGNTEWRDPGPQGPPGNNGAPGTNGTDGADGTSITAVTLTQAAYDALGTPDPNTTYYISG